MLDTATLDNRRALEKTVANEQRERKLRQAEQLLREAAGIEANELVRDEEDNERREARYARNDKREALAGVRYALTRKRRAKDAKNEPVYVLWQYVYTRWQRAGSPAHGVEIRADDILRHLSKHCAKKTRQDRGGFTERHLRGLVRELRLREALDVWKHGKRPRTYLPKLDGIRTGSDLFSLRLLERVGATFEP